MKTCLQHDFAQLQTHIFLTTCDKLKTEYESKGKGFYKIANAV